MVEYRTICEQRYFLIGCQGLSNRLSIVHAVLYIACDVYDTANIVHFLHNKAVSPMTFTFLQLFENFILHAVSMT
jgi:hypothetical protein